MEEFLILHKDIPESCDVQPSSTDVNFVFYETIIGNVGINISDLNEDDEAIIFDIEEVNDDKIVNFNEVLVDDHAAEEQTVEQCNTDLNQVSPEFEASTKQPEAVEKEDDKKINKHKGKHCKRCKKSFNTLKAFRSHEKRHPKMEDVCCDACSKVFPRISELRRHIRTHTGDRPFLCKFCQKSFTQRGHLKVHERLHNTETYTCQICLKSFTQKNLLENHQKIHTGGNDPFSCSFCNKSFTQKCKVKYHERIHHQGKSNRCKHCGKTFARIYDLERHERIHTKDRPYKCTVCEKGFTQVAHLKAHGRVHNKPEGTLQVAPGLQILIEPLYCQECDVTFVDSAQKNFHVCAEKPLDFLCCLQD